MHIRGVVVRKSEFNPVVGDRFLGGENMNLLFISGIVNLLLKTNGGEAEGIILLFELFGVL